MIDLEQLAASASKNDELVVEGESFREVAEALGVDYDSLVEVSRQRALRMIMIADGRGLPDGEEPVELDELHEDALTMLAATWIDGALTVARLRTQGDFVILDGGRRTA